MATTGRQPTDADLSAALADAGFVRLAPAATGDGVAAAGVLARALGAIDVPYQIGVVSGTSPTRSTEADLTVALDRSTPDADCTVAGPRPTSAAVFDAARSLTGESTAPTLAAAGVLSTGAEPAGAIADALAEAGVERRPGIGVPTADLADGLAHSTRLHAPFSGDPEAAEATLAEATVEPDDDEDRRRVASAVAIRTVDAPDATPRAARRVEAVLRPYAGGPFATIEGYADVLEAAVREDPGTAVAVALGHADARDDALSAWRSHARTAHETLREATVRRHAGLVAVTDAEPIGTVARLLRDFRSPEPLALAHGDDQVALAAADEIDASDVLTGATAPFDLTGQITGDADLATQKYPGDLEALVEAIREVSHDG